MSIGKRVAEAIDKYAAGDVESALIPTSIAIDATAQKFYGKPGRGSYKDFIKDNMPLITRIALNGTKILNLILAIPQEILDDCPEIESDASRGCRVEEIFYHVIRCGLLHEGKIPSQFVFTDEAIISLREGRISLPAKLVYGFVMAVVVCPANRGEIIGDNYGIELNGYQLPLNQLWGKRDKLWNLYEAMDEIWKD